MSRLLSVRYTLSYIDPPGPPSTIRHSIPSNSAKVSVSVQWEPPTETGGRDDLTYTVTVSAQLSATVLTSTSVTVTAQYNVDYTVSVVATNCAGNSATAEYNFSTGELIASLNQHTTDFLSCRKLSCADQPHEWSIWTSLQQIVRIHSNHPV